jgi:hypothetical protein
MGEADGLVVVRQVGRALRRPRQRWIAFGLAVAFSLAGCSSPAPAQGSDPAEAGDDPAEPAEPDTPVRDEPPADVELPDEDDLAATWAAFHTAWVEQAAADDPDPAAFEPLATDPTAVVERLIAQRGEARLVTTETELWPRFTIDGDTAEVSDCAIVAQHPANRPDSVATVTVGWEATATATDDGWRIVAARPLDLFCIAEELNDQLLDAYRAFREAKNAAWDPPDPDHPDLERTMAGEQLEFIRELLAEHKREGIVIRDPAPTENAVVFEVGHGRATVSDCAEQVEGYGAFDLETGDRLDELIVPVGEGRLDAQSVDLVRHSDGRWKVEDQAASRDTDCVEGSTRYEVQ